MQGFRKLLVREKSHAIVLSIYRDTAAFPGTERYGLTSQMRRAAFFIPSNIVEGCGRAGKNEWKQYLQVSLGWASEFDYFLLLARDLGLLTPRQHDRLEASIHEVKLMLAGLIRKIGATAQTEKASFNTL